MPTDPLDLIGLAALVLAAAVLYSSVGHAGASGYLAAMALFGVAPATMKPAALVMNIVVAVVGTLRFWSAGLIPRAVLLPLCAASIPAAFGGGALALPTQIFRPLLGVILLGAAWRLWFPGGARASQPLPGAGVLFTLGIVLGFLSGVTGIGGGVFLSPILILAGWEDPRRTAGASAVFILSNSVAGLLGHLATAGSIPAGTPLLAAVALGGGLFGSWLGARRLAPMALRRLLAVVLVIAGVKLVLEG
jgi:uncharacterized membrane protein YfcA